MKSVFRQYLKERFPVGPYCVLVGAMVLAATAAACDGQSQPLALTWRQLLIFATLMLGFFHLRVFDEHKDFDKDRIAHPDRILSRGLLTLGDLRKAGAVAIILQLGLSVALGWHALLWTTAVLLFSVGMFYEFGVGHWLNQHLVVYAISHNPVVALMMAFVTAATLGNTSFSTPALLFIVVASLTSLGFEVGRKLRPPQDTYTKALGTGPAVALLAMVLLGAFGAGRLMLESAALRIALDVVAVGVMIGVFRFAYKPTARGAKIAETFSTISALVIYGFVAADVIMRRGVLWS